MKKLLIIICLVTISNVSFAKEIVQKDHIFEIENVKTLKTETYVVATPEENKTIEQKNIKAASEDSSKLKNISLLINETKSFKKKIIVNFGLNGRSPDKDEEKKLKALSNINIAGQIIIIGYTCKLGSQQQNETLAWDRAEKVEGILNGLGIENCKKYAQPKCCFISTEDALNRRVEVIYNEVPENEGLAAN